MRWQALAVTLGVVAGDQLSKEWALRALSERTIRIAPGASLSLAHNDGFSFSIGAGRGQIIGVAVGLIAIYLARLVWHHQTTHRILLAVILGGAVGNLIDRVFRTDGWPLGVVDFIDVNRFAVFDLADAAVVTGTTLLVVSA